MRFRKKSHLLFFPAHSRCSLLRSLRYYAPTLTPRLISLFVWLKHTLGHFSSITQMIVRSLPVSGRQKSKNACKYLFINIIPFYTNRSRRCGSCLFHFPLARVEYGHCYYHREGDGAVDKEDFILNRQLIRVLVLCQNLFSFNR